MNLRLTLIGLSSLAAFALPVPGADLSKYREFQLGMPLADVAKQLGIAVSGLKVISTRPERIEELDWRIEWMPSARDAKDYPFNDVVFSFYNQALYRISVAYDRDRTQGLTDGDMVESISRVYGAAGPAAHATSPDTIAQWEDEQSQVSLVRLPYYAGLGLVVSSKGPQALAERAILESARMDRSEAPRVEAALQAKRLADSQLADEKARSLNKPAFHP